MRNGRMDRSVVSQRRLRIADESTLALSVASLLLLLALLVGSQT